MLGLVVQSRGCLSGRATANAATTSSSRSRDGSNAERRSAAKEGACKKQSNGSAGDLHG